MGERGLAGQAGRGDGLAGRLTDPDAELSASGASLGAAQALHFATLCPAPSVRGPRGSSQFRGMLFLLVR